MSLSVQFRENYMKQLKCWLKQNVTFLKAQWNTMYLFEDVSGTSVITGFERVWACEEWQVNHCWFTRPQVRASLASLDEGHGHFGSWKGNDAVRLCIMRIPRLYAGICLREQGRGRERVGLYKEQNWKLTLDDMVKSFEIRIYCRALCFRKFIHPTTSEMIHEHLKDGNFSKLIIPLPTTPLILPEQLMVRKVWNVVALETISD